MNKALRRSVRKAFRALPCMGEFIRTAEQGASRRKWYSEAREEIRREIGKGWQTFALILAATSPQQTVEKNLLMTKRIWAVWSLYNWNTDEYTIAEVSELAELDCRIGNVKRIMRGEEMSGPKVSAFAANLIGDESRAVIDTWMMHFIGDHKLNKGMRLAYTRRLERTARALSWSVAETQAAIWCAHYAEQRLVKIEEVPGFYFKLPAEVDSDAGVVYI